VTAGATPASCAGRGAPCAGDRRFRALPPRRYQKKSSQTLQQMTW
jgi:hypothetical protein